jgi:hypothetical protein
MSEKRSPLRAESEHEQLVRAYEALGAMDEPPVYQLWTLAEKALNLAGVAQAEVERLREGIVSVLAEKPGYDLEMEVTVGVPWRFRLRALIGAPQPREAKPQPDGGHFHA